MKTFKEFLKEDGEAGGGVPANSGFGGPNLAKYDPLLGKGGKKKMFRRKPVAGQPLAKVPRLRGMELP